MNGFYCILLFARLKRSWQPTMTCAHTHDRFRQGDRKASLTGQQSSVESFLSALRPQYISASQMFFSPLPQLQGWCVCTGLCWLPEWMGTLCFSEAASGCRAAYRTSMQHAQESSGSEKHQWVGGRETPHYTPLQGSDVTQCSSTDVC